jgi:hypothetical protein
MSILFYFFINFKGNQNIKEIKRPLDPDFILFFFKGCLSHFTMYKKYKKLIYPQINIIIINRPRGKDCFIFNNQLDILFENDKIIIFYVFLQVMTKPFYLFIFNCNHRCKRDG